MTTMRTRVTMSRRVRGFAAAFYLAAGAAAAHHSYAMFDISKALVVGGSVAKVEWTNPHVFVWLYVPKSGEPGKYGLYAFETDGPTLLTRRGWTKDTLQPGEPIRIQYFPLKDGRTGGELIRAIRADGSATAIDPLLPGVSRIPDVPGVPGAPGVPGLPDVSSIPDVSR
ncbi:MAG TPA: DUF6152 family protein, partial [Gammaproteobacteria bacterium]|nr:DUF6152 family protein [Gammaproteobacteria bacterium]